MNPFLNTLDMQSQLWEKAGEFVEKADNAPDRIETMANVEVGQTPSEVVYSENKLDLLHYKPDEEKQHDVPILIVYALINKPYILDLQPDRSVVKRFVENGFDVYMIDWGEPSRLDTHLTLHDYVNRYIDNCVDVVRERSGHDEITIFSYCMGGSMSAMYTALNPDKIKNLILLASGLYFDDSAGVLELWGEEDYYDPRLVAETFGNAPSEFLGVGFDLMDPVDNLVTKYIGLYDNMDDEYFVENFGRMEKWLSDGVDVAGEAYAEFLEKMYQGNELYRNELSINGEQVDIENIDMPVLQIVGGYDHLIPPESSKPFNDVLPSDDKEIIEFDSGHIGLSVSSRSHENLWPEVCEWLAERSSVDETDEEQVESTEKSSLTDIEGIGEGYASRLRTAGVESINDLINADTENLSDEIDVSVQRINQWQERASQLS